MKEFQYGILQDSNLLLVHSIVMSFGLWHGSSFGYPVQPLYATFCLQSIIFSACQLLSMIDQFEEGCIGLLFPRFAMAVVIWYIKWTWSSQSTYKGYWRRLIKCSWSRISRLFNVQTLVSFGFGKYCCYWTWSFLGPWFMSCKL